MGWLGCWRKRVKITIDHNDVSAALTGFPALIYLSTSSGINAEDVSFVFDELGANSLKIAVTINDGITQCYCEVEQWDSVNEKAWIWVKVPSVSNVNDTVLYLYYDNRVADNTTYVGDDPNDIATNNVWDANFMMVHHLQGAAAANLDDSTNNNNDVTASTGTPVYNYASKIGNGIWFDVASSERVSMNDAATLDGFSEATWEFWFYMHSAPGAGLRRCQFSKYLTTGNQRSWLLTLHNDGVSTQFKLNLSKLGTASDGDERYTWTPTADTWYHIGIRWDSVTATTPVLYINGVATAWTASTACNAAIFNSSDVLYLGYYNDGSYHDGAFDEARISNLDRGAAYMVASYESQRDNFVDYGTEERLRPFFNLQDRGGDLRSRLRFRSKATMKVQ